MDNSSSELLAPQIQAINLDTLHLPTLIQMASQMPAHIAARAARAIVVFFRDGSERYFLWSTPEAAKIADWVKLQHASPDWLYIPPSRIFAVDILQDTAITNEVATLRLQGDPCRWEFHRSSELDALARWASGETAPRVLVP